MHPFIGISLLRLCLPGGTAVGRVGGARDGFLRRRRQDARTRRALGGLTEHLRRDIGLEAY